MRIVFMGTPDFAVPTLEVLIENHEVVGVVTQPDRKKGRGKKVQFPPVKEKALEHDIPVLQPDRIKDEAFLAELKAMNPDAIVVVAFGRILPEVILDLPPFGCINVHASLLPKYRGAAPMQWAIINGEKETGVTIMYMDKGMDTGDMLAKVVVPLDAKETGESLHDKLSVAGGPALLKVLDEIEAGTAVRTPQNDQDSTYAGMLTKDLGHIDWRADAVSIERLIRGLNSWPSAYTHYSDRTLKIWSADVTTETSQAEPGTVTAVSRDSMVIACGSGSLILREVQLQGKKRMSVHDFLLGNKIETGMIFS